MLSSNQSHENLRMYRMMSNTSSFSKREGLIQYEQISDNRSQMVYIFIHGHNADSNVLWICFHPLNGCSVLYRRSIFVQGSSLSKPCHFFLLCCNFLPKMLCCNTVIMQHHNASSPPGSWLWFWQILSSIIIKIISSWPSASSSSSSYHQQHIMLSLLERAYLSFKLVMDLHLYNLYSKVYKSFLPFQKWFSFCCSTECQWITICRPCYKVCVFCATFGFVLLSRREEKLSIKTLSDKIMFFVWMLCPLYFARILQMVWLKR